MKRKLNNQFKQDKFCETVRRRYKRRFKKAIGIRDSEIMKEINSYLNEVMDEVIKGKKVILDKHSYMRVVGIPAVEHKAFARLAGKGLTLSTKGKVTTIKSIPRRKDFIYKIVYVNTITDKKIYFDAHPKFKEKLKKSLNETNTHYHIVTNGCNFLESAGKVTKNRNYD